MSISTEAHVNGSKPAFPTDGGYYGLSKREYFACAAMAAMAPTLLPDEIDSAAEKALDIADHLLISLACDDGS